VWSTSRKHDTIVWSKHDKASLITDVPEKVLDLSLAVQCLNSEHQQFLEKGLNAFLADKDFQQAERQIIDEMRNETFMNPFCNTLKGEL
jgi:hypothetical protein